MLRSEVEELRAALATYQSKGWLGMNAPERVWLDWPDANRGGIVYAEPPERDTQEGQTAYIRADLYDAQSAEITRLRAQVEAADRLAEAGREAVEVVHKSYVAATMEAVNAGGAHPLTKNYDAWRVRCMNAETAMRAALAAYQPQREETP